MVKKKGKKPNGSKREECEEAGELFLEVRDHNKKDFVFENLTIHCRISLQRRSLFAL